MFDEITTIIGLIISAGVAAGTISLAFFAFRQIKDIKKENKNIKNRQTIGMNESSDIKPLCFVS